MTKITEELVEKIGLAFTQRGLKLVTAESCTGGGLSFAITDIAGSSDWFERGFVTYSNEAKIEMLTVNPKTITAFGAVSKETAEEMAKGALLKSHADASVAITGVAGPGGGSKEKPVGTVWIACATKEEAPQSYLNHFQGSRNEIRAQAIEQALKYLLKIT